MRSAARTFDQHHNAKPDPLDVFLARCEARASLVAHGLHDLQDSVDTLQQAAVEQGLVKQYGQDEIQWLMSEAFGRWRLSDDG
jgi:NADH:ubiquinone oxidoreductase subunit B-like Fe-S oxidoreductase